jgi:AcrR family transcriptional regulator
MSAAKPAGNRERLLKAALECIQEKGYARTTARDLVAASETNLNSIGYHFGSKEELLNEAIIIGFQAWVAEIERTTFASESARGPERLERGLAAVVDRFDDLRPLLVSFVEAFPQAVRSPELRERMAQLFEETRKRIAEMFVRAFAEAGVEIDDAQAATLGGVVAAVSDGLLLQWLLDPDSVPTAREVVEALATLSGVSVAVAETN